MSQPLPPGAVLYEVVGGGAAGGILVREGKETTSQESKRRLAKGAWVVQLEVDGDRLRFWKVFGAGPKSGWVSLKVKGKDLLEKRQGPPPRPPLPPWPPETKAVTLGYWDNRSLAAPARMALHYAGVECDYRHYELVEDPEEEGEFDGAMWQDQAKPHLYERNGLINLPYVILDGRVITQSGAVLLAIGRAYGLGGDGEDQVRSNQMVLMEGMELRGKIGDLAYTKPRDEHHMKAAVMFAGPFPAHLDKLERYLSQCGSDCFSGHRPLVADFLVWESLDQISIMSRMLRPIHEGFATPLISNFPLLRAFHRRLRRLPALEKYFDSDLYRLNCQNKPAFFKPSVTEVEGALEGDDDGAAAPAEAAAAAQEMPGPPPGEAAAEPEAPSPPPWPPETKPVTLGYWKNRSLAAASRMALSYAGADYEDRWYEVQPGEEEGSWSGHEWHLAAKPHLIGRNALINLPYVIIDGPVITHSQAVLLAIGRKFNLNGDNEDQVSSNEMVLMQAVELRDVVNATAYTPEESFLAAAHAMLEETVPGHLTKLLKYMEQRGTEFFSGPRPLTADFLLWEVFDQMEEMARFVRRFPPLNSYAPLRKFHKNFKKLPEMQSYFASDAYRLPLQNKAATFKICTTSK